MCTKKLVFFMKINKTFLQNRINDILVGIKKASEILAVNFDSLTWRDLYSLRYIIIGLVEAAGSICLHITRRMYNISPTGYVDCFKKLNELGVINSELTDRITKVAKLRSLLVHHYWVTDDKLLYKESKMGIKDFKEFISCVKEVIEHE